MNETEILKIRQANFVKVENLVKRLNNPSFLISNLSYRSRNRLTFSKIQLKKWLWQDKFEVENIISSLIMFKAISEITTEIYAITKDFQCFFPILRRGESVKDIGEF